MPIYDYRCENGHTLELLQGVNDPDPKTCEQCGGRLERVLHAPAIRFRGSGFYATTYPKGRSGRS